jgi:translation initiation factor IF-3
VNAEIRISPVRLVGAEGEKIGVLSLIDALKMAEGLQLDLVEISPQADPPVCRIMDYGKFVFRQKKQKAQAQKKQKKIQVKEIKIRSTTEEGDYQVKLKSLVRFLESGDKAKVSLRFRGREVMHQDLGMQMMNRLLNDLSFYGSVEQAPKLEGRQIVMVISSVKKK